MVSQNFIMVYILISPSQTALVESQRFKRHCSSLQRTAELQLLTETYTEVCPPSLQTVQSALTLTFPPQTPWIMISELSGSHYPAE